MFLLFKPIVFELLSREFVKNIEAISLDNEDDRGENWRGKIVIFGKKSHNAEKNWKGGLFGIFQHPFWRKTAKKIVGGKLLYSEKNLTRPKKTGREDPLGFSNIHSDAKQQKNCRGTLWNFLSKKYLAVPKKNKGRSRPVWYVTRQNRKNLFGSVR